MADREEFQKKLAELLAKAAAQGNRMTQEELAAFFRDENLTEEILLIQSIPELAKRFKASSSRITKKY